MEKTFLDKNNTFYIKHLFKRISSFQEGYRQNLVLLTPYQEELNYLVHNLTSVLPHFKLCQFIFLEPTYSTAENLFKTIAFQLLNKSFCPKTNIDFLINNQESNLPETVTFIKETIKNKEYSHFLSILELINIYTKETNKSCIFFIHEFTFLEKIYIKNYISYLSKFIMFHPKTMIILTTSRTTEALKILDNELNLLFGNLEKVFLDKTSSVLNNYLILNQYLQPYKISACNIAFLLDILADRISYYPLLTKIISTTDESLQENHKIKIALRKMFYSTESNLHEKYLNKIDILLNYSKSSSSYLDILLCLTQGYLRKNEIAERLKLKSSALNNKLQKLIELNYITYLGSIYRIKDNLFSFWLSHVFYPLYIYPMPLSEYDRNYLVEEKIEETMQIFSNLFFKDRIQRIIDLLYTCYNDTLIFNGKKISLPKIKQAKTIHDKENILDYIIAEGEEILFIGIKTSDTEEKDICAYMERTKSLAKKVKRFFITFSQFSSTAKVIAKQNKIITWDINDINQILKTYHKPIIINEAISSF